MAALGVGAATRGPELEEGAQGAARDRGGVVGHDPRHAARERGPGHAFAGRARHLEEFEATFPFEETADQAAAIEDVLGDLQRPKPSDRIVCGDVGYGKTEVAVRAAFRVAMDGKQVAMLVPTTILAQQHLTTFRDRLADYPVEIEVLSRFRTAKAQKYVLERVADG